MRERTYQPWTNREIKRLKAVYPGSTRAELAAEFPSRTLKSIITNAGVLKLRKENPRRLQDFWKQIAATHVYTFDILKQAAQ